jgi:hypothetical protein
MRGERKARALALASALASALAITLSPSAGRATEFEVDAHTALQGYEVVSPWGDVILDRRRFTQTIGLAVYNLQGQYHPGEADYRLVVGMRLDADFGINARLPAAQAGGETNYATGAGNGVRFIPGLATAPVDLMYGYLEGRNLVGGLFGFRLGRQYVTDALGLWSFDGALVRLTTPFYVQLEAYGGAEQRGGLPLSTGRYERQGIWRGSHTGFGLGPDQPSVVDYPSYLYTQPAPALGFAAETTGLPWMHARLSYRRVYNTGTALTTQFPEGNGGGYHAIDGIRISQDRLGFSGDIGKASLGTLRGGFTYDLYNQIVASWFGNVEVHAGKHATFGLNADFFVPTFDADSIWNWFTHSPITTLTGRAVLRFGKRFDIAANGGARLWMADGDPTPAANGLSKFGAGECAAAQAALKTGTLDCARGQVYLDPTADAVKAYARDSQNRATTTTVDAIADVSSRYRFGSGDVALRGMLETGKRGSREGADVAGEYRFDGGRFTAGARMSVYGWSDPTRPDRDAVSFGYVLSGGFKPKEVAKLRVEWEHDMNRLSGQRYRVVGLIDLLVLR